MDVDGAEKYDDDEDEVNLDTKIALSDEDGLKCERLLSLLSSFLSF
jgi:hypothetical protein